MTLAAPSATEVRSRLHTTPVAADASLAEMVVVAGVTL